MNDKRGSFGAIAAEWWYSELGQGTGAGRMARAKLRRCDTPAEALGHGVVHRLHAALRSAGRDLTRDPERLALVAIILANIKENHSAEAAARFGELVGDRPRLSALRFQGLMRTAAPIDLIRPLRRALAQIDYQANVARLANDLLHWGDACRNNWCFKYYGGANEVPFEQTEEKTA